MEVNSIMSEQTKNALTEIGNIGAGNAATSLSVILSSRMKVSPPKVEICDFNELEEKLGGADSTVVGVLSDIEGDVTGMLLFALGVEEAESLAKTLIVDESANTDSPVAADDISWHSDMGLSAISEIANIIIGSYVASLETLSGLKMRKSVPQMNIDMAGAILSVPCVAFATVSDKALLINSEFEAGDKKINGYIMLLSEMHSFNLLLNKLGIGGIDE